MVLRFFFVYGEIDMINKLTGEPVSEEMQSVLKRLAASESVSEAEISGLKEIREANSCLGNGVPTIKGP